MNEDESTALFGRFTVEVFFQEVIAMHYHLEVVLPASVGRDEQAIKDAIASVLDEYNENGREENEGRNRHGFWDWYVIGGRFAGTKQMAQYDTDALRKFCEWAESVPITVAGVRAGKPRLEPASQIATVDAKWNEMFPREDGKLVACPLFDHSNDKYGRDGSSTIEGDISRPGDSKAVKCARVIFAGLTYHDGQWQEPFGPAFMLAEDEWNGKNHMPIRWDGTIGDALKQWLEHLDRMSAAYVEKVCPTDDWICVTVDYHS